MLPFCAVTDDTLRNVAKRKPALQVSTYSDQYGSHNASLANDGNKQTCAASKPETNPWWSVDLESPTLVFMVKLTNAGDDKGRRIYACTQWMLLSSLDAFLNVGLL